MSVNNQASVALGFPSTNALAKIADIHSSTLVDVYSGTRPLSDENADKLTKAILYQNGWNYLDSAFQLAGVLNFLQHHRAYLHQTPVREISDSDVKRWHRNYLQEIAQSRNSSSKALDLESLQLSTPELLKKVLDYLMNCDKMQESFCEKYSQLIVPAIKRGIQEIDCYNLLKRIYSEIRYIAHLSEKIDFVTELSKWFLKKSQRNGDIQVRVSALGTLAWELTKQNTKGNLEHAKKIVDEAWKLVNSRLFLEQLCPEDMDIMALLTEVRLRLVICLNKESDFSLKRVDFEELVRESRALLRKAKSWDVVSPRLKLRYELPLDYQHGVYLHYLGEYDQSRRKFENLVEKTNVMGWIRVEQAAYSWIATIHEAQDNRIELSSVLEKINVLYLANRQAIREEIIGRMGEKFV